MESSDEKRDELIDGGRAQTSEGPMEGAESELLERKVNRMVAVGDVGRLVQLLGHQDWRIRIKGIRGLGEVGDLRAIALLYACLADSDERIRDEASWALTTIGLRRQDAARYH